MSVETRAHIASAVLQERAVLKRTCIWGGSPYTKRKAVSVRGHAGDDIRITLEDLGDALRVLKVSAVDLGYKPTTPRKAKP